MRKIIEVIEMPLLTIGGVQKGTSNRINWYVKHDIDFVLLDCPMQLWNSKLPVILKCFVLNILNFFRLIKLRIQGYKKVHFHGINSALVGVLLKPFMKSYLTLHGVQVYKKTGWKYLFQSLYYNVVNRLALNSVQDVMCISEFEQKFYSKFTSRYMLIIRNAISVADDDCNWNYKCAQRQVLFVGRLYPGSAVEVFLKSHIHLKDRTIKYIIVGDGTNMAELKERYCRNANIIFKGFDSDVQKYMDDCRMMVSHVTNNIIGYGNNVIEALGFGIPLILGMDYVNCKVFTNKEVCLVKKDSPRLIASMIDKFMDDAFTLYGWSVEGNQTIKKYTCGIQYNKIVDVIFGGYKRI